MKLFTGHDADVDQAACQVRMRLFWGNGVSDLRNYVCSWLEAAEEGYKEGVGGLVSIRC